MSERMVASDGEDVIDLDSLTTAELLRERADAMTAIPMITAQLQDKDRRPPSPEDDSPEWEEYRDWRRRARWALAHQKADLVTIRNILSERKDAGTVGNLLKMQTAALEELTETQRLYIERGKLIREELAGSSSEGLLLRAYRIIRHLLHDQINTLPDVLDEDDRRALALVGIHCRTRYGVGRLRKYIEASASVTEAAS